MLYANNIKATNYKNCTQKNLRVAHLPLVLYNYPGRWYVVISMSLDIGTNIPKRQTERRSNKKKLFLKITSNYATE